MKVAGIIAEYNPLHSGHIYQMDETRKMTGADYIVVAMSGSFTQRGIPAFFDKYIRTEMALRAGADLVIELPVSVSTGSSEYFAKGAVTLLNSLGVITHLSFGSECGDIELLKVDANFFANESVAFREIVRKELAEGKTYPQAIKTAVYQTAPDDLNTPEFLNIKDTPNNTLGIEYIKALNLLNSSILPVTLKRLGSDYNDTEIKSSCDKNCFPSATALRKLAMEKSVEEMINLLPEEVDKVLKASSNYNSCNDTYKNDNKTVTDKYNWLTEDDFSTLLNTALLLNNSPLADYADISPDMANRLEQLIELLPLSFSELATQLKTRQFTLTRIQRALFHLLLGVKNEHMQLIKESTIAPYIRVLGMKENSSALMKEINKNALAPIITRPVREIKQLSSPATELFTQDLKAYELYRVAFRGKYPDSHYLPSKDYKGMLVI